MKTKKDIIRIAGLAISAITLLETIALAVVVDGMALSLGIGGICVIAGGIIGSRFKIKGGSIESNPNSRT